MVKRGYAAVGFRVRFSFKANSYSSCSLPTVTLKPSTVTFMGSSFPCRVFMVSTKLRILPMISLTFRLVVSVCPVVGSALCTSISTT